MMQEKESAEDKERRKGTRILVVDDDPSIRELLRELLVEEGHKVRMAENGRKALERIRKESFDLVLTDLKMPEMGGVELLKELQKTASQMRVIVMTAANDLETAVKMKNLGAYDYVAKPFCHYMILEKVARALGREDSKKGGNDHG